MFRVGISSIPGGTIIPLWLGRHFLVCENRAYHENVRMTAAEMKYMRRTAGYTWTDYKTKAQNAKELKITPALEKLLEYKINGMQHVNRMPRNRLPRVMKYYSPTGRRNDGQQVAQLHDIWWWRMSSRLEYNFLFVGLGSWGVRGPKILPIFITYLVTLIFHVILFSLSLSAWHEDACNKNITLSRETEIARIAPVRFCQLVHAVIWKMELFYFRAL